MARTRRVEEASFNAVVTDSPFRVGFYLNSQREKRKNAPMARFQGMSGQERISGEA
jgi:hypothetical protein